jgi:hypothetical protein
VPVLQPDDDDDDEWATLLTHPAEADAAVRPSVPDLPLPAPTSSIVSAPAAASTESEFERGLPVGKQAVLDERRMRLQSAALLSEERRMRVESERLVEQLRAQLEAAQRSLLLMPAASSVNPHPSASELVRTAEPPPWTTLLPPLKKRALHNLGEATQQQQPQQQQQQVPHGGVSLPRSDLSRVNRRDPQAPSQSAQTALLTNAGPSLAPDPSAGVAAANGDRDRSGGDDTSVDDLNMPGSDHLYGLQEECEDEEATDSGQKGQCLQEGENKASVAVEEAEQAAAVAALATNEAAAATAAANSVPLREVKGVAVLEKACSSPSSIICSYPSASSPGLFKSYTAEVDSATNSLKFHMSTESGAIKTTIKKIKSLRSGDSGVDLTGAASSGLLRLFFKDSSCFVLHVGEESARGFASAVQQAQLGKLDAR